MKRTIGHGTLGAIVLAAAAMGASQVAPARTYTVSVTGTFQSGYVASNFQNGSLFGLSGYPRSTDLAGMPGKVVFTIDDALGQASESKFASGVPYASQITSTPPGVTKLVTAQITINGVTVLGGGQYPQDIFTPIASRSLGFSGLNVIQSAVRVWTSEKNSPFTAGARAILECVSPQNAPFTTDYRWNAAFQYAVPPDASDFCTVSILYYRGSSRGWAQSEGKIRATSVTMTGLGPPLPPPSTRIFFERGGVWTDVSDKTVPVVAGQAIALCAATAAAQCNSQAAPSTQTQSWQICGTISCASTIAGYTPTPLSYETAEFSGNSQINLQDWRPTFYWVAGGSQTVTLNHRNDSGASGVSRATFVVDAPPLELPTFDFRGHSLSESFTVRSLPRPIACVGFSSIFSTQATFGGLDPLKFYVKPGMNFFAPSAQSGPTGHYHWLQTVFSSVTTNTTTEPFQQGPGLDNLMWYTNITNELAPTHVVDAPGLYLPDDATHLQRVFNAKMHLFWQAEAVTAGSKTIPLYFGYFSWGFTVNFDRATTDAAWEHTVLSSRIPTAFESSSEYPTWSGVAVNSECDFVQ